MRLILSILLIFFPLISHSADRMALVIGIAEYQHIGALKNTVNDAGKISQTLESIGFEVTTKTNISAAQMRAAVDQFAFDAETADLALIYYAGHGIEVQGENFLIPVDTQIKPGFDVRTQMLSLTDLLQAVEHARKMRIVILDSCRDNPFGSAITVAQTAPPETRASQDTTRGGAGLAAPSPDRGTLVAFAAKDGMVAMDGAGDNSPFATALADKLKQPGLEISLMFRQVRDQVLKATFNRQEPHTYGSLSGVPFYLAGSHNSFDPDPSIAWSSLRPEQEAQLAKLAEGGDTRSMLGLGYIRLNPDAGRFNPTEAVSFFVKAAQAGSPEAQFELAKLYEKGLGVEQNATRALELYNQAADQDFPDAINDLGFLYYQGGLGLPRDKERALTLFERAADLRHPQAMFNFAALIDDGLIASKGPKDAAEYLYAALRSGSEDVYKILSNKPTMFKAKTRKALQTKLQEYEFYKGSIDGDFGPGTQRSIRMAYGLNG